MRTLWFNMLMATAILTLAVRTDAAMEPRGSGSPNRAFNGSRGAPATGFSAPGRTFSGNRGTGFGGGRQNWGGNHGYYHHRGGGSSLFFSFGFPLGYGYGYPYHGYYYPSYGYYPVYQYPVYESHPVYYEDAASAPYVYDSSAEYPPSIPPQAVQVRSYLELGHDWAKDLRLDVITWDQLVVYLKAYIVNAPPASRDEFRRGWIAGYGLHAEEAYDKAMKQAVESLAADKNGALPPTNQPAQTPASTPQSGY